MYNAVEGSVSESALVKRINRKLLPEGERLQTSRGAHAEQQLGCHYITDTNGGCVCVQNVDVEAYGRELGVLGVTDRVVG
jgi:hypothetical protein